MRRTEKRLVVMMGVNQESASEAAYQARVEYGLDSALVERPYSGGCFYIEITGYKSNVLRAECFLKGYDHAHQCKLASTRWPDGLLYGK